jgi:hypothetical protein
MDLHRLHSAHVLRTPSRRRHIVPASRSAGELITAPTGSGRPPSVSASTIRDCLRQRFFFMTYSSGALHLCVQRPQRARSSVRTFSHPPVVASITVVGAAGTGSFALSKVRSSAHIPFRQSFPLRPMSVTRALSIRKNASRASKDCIAQTPFCRPHSEDKAQNEAVARQIRSLCRVRDIRPQRFDTVSQVPAIASQVGP